MTRLAVDLSVAVGSVSLANPVMTASGTAGHAAELQPYVRLGALGAVVVKSLSVDPWPGNPAPRVHETPAGMLNSVGLQGPGLAAWCDTDLPLLRETGAKVVVSIWGHRVEEFARAASVLCELVGEAPAPATAGDRRTGATRAPGNGISAIEVNVSCPNVEDRRRMFAHSPEATAEVVAAVVGACPGLPAWVKLSPNVADIAEIAGAALGAGAEAVTLVNTVLGMAIDVDARRPVLGSGAAGGGLSGPAIHPVAVRAVYDVRTAFPDAPIIGVGGVMSGRDAVELLMAGANAVQVGTATFRDPKASMRVLGELEAWCCRNGVTTASELTGAGRG